MVKWFTGWKAVKWEKRGVNRNQSHPELASPTHARKSKAGLHNTRYYPGVKSLQPQKGKPSTASRITSLVHATLGDVFPYKKTSHLLQKTSPDQLRFSHLWSFVEYLLTSKSLLITSTTHILFALTSGSEYVSEKEPSANNNYKLVNLLPRLANVGGPRDLR